MRSVTLSRDDSGSSWVGRLSLQGNLGTVLLGLSLQSSVLLDSVQELLTTLRVLDVLNSQVDLLLDISVANNLVDKNTDGGLGDVVNDTSLTVVVLVGHTLLDRTVSLDVNDVTNLVDSQVSGQRNCSVLLEVTLEHVTSTRSVTTTIC